MAGERREGGAGAVVDALLILLGLVRLHRIAPGIVPANPSLYKLEKQSGSESFRPTNPTQTNKALRNSRDIFPLQHTGTHLVKPIKKSF
jgi:hypothetical protein